MSLNPSQDDWRGEHLIRVPRAPKPEAPPPKGYLPPDIKARVYDMGRNGSFVPQIAKATGLTVARVRAMLIQEGIDFKRAKLSATGKRKR